MAERVSRKRRRQLVVQAERMRSSKVARRKMIDYSDELTPGEASVSSVQTERSEEAVPSLDGSFLLPVTPIEAGDTDSSDESDDDYDANLTVDEAESIYRDWMSELDNEDVKMMALMMYDAFQKRFGLTKCGAAAEVALLLGRSSKTVRMWRKDFYGNKGQFSQYKRGKYHRFCAFDDESYKKLALTWIRSNAVRKGRPNMTAASFQQYLNTKLLPDI